MKRRRMWLVIVPVILFIMLAVCIKAGVTENYEGWAYSEAVEKMSPTLTNIVKAITHIGDAVVLIVSCLLLMVLPKTRRTIALPISMALILSALLNVLLKDIFARERPDILRLINETSYSFPSGHSMNNAAFYTMLIFLVFKYSKNKFYKAAFAALSTFLIVAIGFSRIYLGVHYAGDVLGGWLIGFTVSVCVYFVWDSKLSHSREKT